MAGTLTAVLLTASIHTGSQHFNNDNLGIGVEYTNGLTYGVYKYRNSYDKPSTMISVSKQYQYIGIGIAAASGYQDDANKILDEYLVCPEITLKINDYMRIKTSYPFGALNGVYDVVNFQLTYGFK